MIYGVFNLEFFCSWQFSWKKNYFLSLSLDFLKITNTVMRTTFSFFVSSEVTSIAPYSADQVVTAVNDQLTIWLPSSTLGQSGLRYWTFSHFILLK